MLSGPSFLQSSNWWLIENLGEADLIVNIPLSKIKQDQVREVNMTQYRWKLKADCYNFSFKDLTVLLLTIEE